MIKVKGLEVRAGSFLLSCGDLEIKKGEYFILLGPMGAGKTIFLESIAGVRQVECGSVFIGGKDVTALNTEHRNIGIVYQKKMLFPHLCVKDNITFGLKVRKVGEAEVQNRLAWVCGLLDIEYLLKRDTSSLSGGEQQKIALARTLITKPDVLLLDEPLSALDPHNKETMQNELRKLNKKLGITVIHVTHDFNEAASLGGRVAVLGDGRFHQIGCPYEVFARPVSEFVARFTMAKNIFSGEVERGSEAALFKANGLNLELESSVETGNTAVIRPEKIILSKTGGSDNNTLKVRVEAFIKHTQNANVLLNASGIELNCSLSLKEADVLKIKEGDELFAFLPPSSIHVIDEIKD